MLCRICNSHNAVYRKNRRQYMCTECFILTPKKISYKDFKKIYFKSDDTVAKDVVKVFYNDYLTSIYTIEEYILQTTEKY